MRYWDFLATTSYTHASISQMLRAAGYADVQCVEDTPAVHGLKSAVRWVLWKCIRAVGRLMLAAETGESGRDAIFSQVFLVVAIK